MINRQFNDKLAVAVCFIAAVISFKILNYSKLALATGIIFLLVSIYGLLRILKNKKFIF